MTDMKEQVLRYVSPDYPWADRFCFLPQVDSTNDYLKKLAAEGAPHGTVALSDHQTGGHGRRGRSFLSPPGGGLYLSIGLRPEWPASRLGTRQAVDRFRVAAAELDALHTMSCGLLTEQETMLTQYRKDCITIGQEISLVRGDEVRHGKALDVDDEGALVVRFPDGHTEAVNSGEVSVRGMYGYV